MSGYLEVKYPFKSNLGLNPFKSWRRQWCILRPSATSGGGSLAVYCSEAGAAAGAVELPSGCAVRRAKSRSRPHAFAVFSVEEPGKPRVLLAARSHQDAQLWMDKIRALVDGNQLLGTEKLLKDSYSVSVVATDLSRKCQLSGESELTVGGAGLSLSRPRRPALLLEWRHVTDVLLARGAGDRHRTCTIGVDSAFVEGGGELRFGAALAGELAAAVRSALPERARACAPARVPTTALAARRLSRSEGDLRARADDHSGEVRRSSWYSGPSEISFDDTDLIMSKEAQRIPSGPLARCSGAGDLALRARALLHLSALAYDDSAPERLSMVSLASCSSGVYEEIAEERPGDRPADRPTERPSDRPVDRPRERSPDPLEEPAYESVAECVYATMRRPARRAAVAPPLPPRHPFGTMKLGESWNSRVNSAGAGGGGGAGAGGADGGVTRHSSLGSLPRHCRPLAKPPARQPFSVFRKRLKSDSRIATSPKSETAKENKDIETKKKKFDFPPPRDIFKSFKVSRKMKNLKITPGTLAKGETKSCEFLDEGRGRRAPGRCAKSFERLDEPFAGPLDGSFSEPLDEPFDEPCVERLADEAALALPHEIVQLIVRGRQARDGARACLRACARPPEPESVYVPMSPVTPAPLDLNHHYIVMSPRTHLA